MFVVDASVVLRWFVDQPGHEAAAIWLRRFAADPTLLVAPDLLRFEVCGGLARLQPPRDPAWAARCFERFGRLGLRSVPTSADLFQRAIALSREVKLGGLRRHLSGARRGDEASLADGGYESATPACGRPARPRDGTGLKRPRGPGDFSS